MLEKNRKFDKSLVLTVKNLKSDSIKIIHLRDKIPDNYSLSIKN